ncbi:MAG: AAA family ATPase [Desulfurococcaceae archaeon]
MLFILLTGMPGSGKSIFVDIVRNEFKIPVYSMGDIVREEVYGKKRDVTPRDMLNTAIELRERFGLDIIARRVYERVDKTHRVVVIDGVRSIYEVDFFRNRGETVIIAIHASPLTRFNRLINRNRPGDPKNWDEFRARDEIELSLGIGNVIALADYILVNESSIEDFKESIRKLLSKILVEKGI